MNSREDVSIVLSVQGKMQNWMCIQANREEKRRGHTKVETESSGSVFLFKYNTLAAYEQVGLVFLWGSPQLQVKCMSFLAWVIECIFTWSGISVYVA